MRFTYETFVGRPYGSWTPSKERFPTAEAAEMAIGRIRAAELKSELTPFDRRVVGVKRR